MSNIPNHVSYLPTTRNFPPDLKQLTVEINKTNVDIANAVNNSIDGFFSTTTPALTREAWYYFQNQKQQTFRKLYLFTSPGSIAHEILNYPSIAGFSRIWGTFVDTGGVWHTLPYVDVTSATNQITITVNSTDINIIAGAGAPPTISSGFIVLEWLSQA